jgi:hypothetical protein
MLLPVTAFRNDDDGSGRDRTSIDPFPALEVPLKRVTAAMVTSLTFGLGGASALPAHAMDTIPAPPPACGCELARGAVPEGKGTLEGQLPFGPLPGPGDVLVKVRPDAGGPVIEVTYSLGALCRAAREHVIMPAHEEVTVTMTLQPGAVLAPGKFSLVAGGVVQVSGQACTSDPSHGAGSAEAGSPYPGGTLVVDEINGGRVRGSFHLDAPLPLSGTFDGGECDAPPFAADATCCD